MKLILPNKLNTSTEIVFKNTKSIAVIGANGAGKTRFGSRLEETHAEITHRISAQKSLSMPTEVSPKSRERAEEEFWYGGQHENKDWLKTIGKKSYRWQNNINTSLLNDYHQLLILLHTEEYEESLKFQEGEISKPTTKLDRIQRIWEEILPHRKLIKRAGIIETYPSDKPTEKYNASEMSDGERVIFYLIGETVCAKPNSLIILDEPEMHIHKSITKKLWDAIEKERPDCTFVYLTHDIDFATSRQNAIKIWLKSYEGNQIWDYEILEEGNPIPEQVLLEILGSRKPILFTEGDYSSIDYFLYQQIFPEFTVTSLGNCNKVFETTKSFNEQKEFHHLTAIGIIDRDRRTEDDVKEIRKLNILVPDVSEAENLLLLEDVIKIVASKMYKDPDAVLKEVKNNVLDLFSKELQFQATQHSIFIIKKIYERGLNPKVKEFAELESVVKKFTNNVDYKNIYQELEDCFSKYISNNDYLSVLKVYNNKGIIHASGLSQLCGLGSKNNEYFNFVISILKENSNESQTIRQAIKQTIN